MHSPRHARRHVWRWIGGALLLLLAGALLGLWWRLPRVVEWAAARAGSDLGFDEVRIAVDRADLGGLRAHGVLARMAGLEIQLDSVGADYSLAGLVGGQVSRLDLSGLSVTLDFVRPRRSFLPDAVSDLLAQFGGGGELVWPVDELAWSDCAIVLLLPGGPHRIAVEGSAVRQRDGRIAFELHAENPAERLHVTGVVKTETLSGGVRIEELRLNPAALLVLAGQLGLEPLPPDVMIDCESVALTGNAQLADGELASAHLEMRVPRVRGRAQGFEAALESLEIVAMHSAEGAFSGRISGNLVAAGGEGVSLTAPARLEGTVGGGRIHATVAPLALAVGDNARVRAAVAVESGIPPLGGEARARIGLAVEEASAGGLSLAPVTVEVAGWLDSVRLTAGELRCVDGVPGAVRGLEITARNLAGPERSLSGTAKLAGLAGLADLLPDGWSIVEPALPSDLATVQFSADLSDRGISASASVESSLPSLRVAREATTFRCAPKLGLTATFDGHAAGLSASVAIDEIRTDLAGLPPGVDAVSASLEVSPLSLESLNALVAGGVPSEDFGITLKAGVGSSPELASLTAKVQHFAAQSALQATAGIGVENISGAWPGLNAEGLSITGRVETGLLDDAVWTSWLKGVDTAAAARAIVPGLAIDLSVSANTLEAPGLARAEWVGATLAKAREPGGPPIQVRLTANAGMLRAPPETLEQPAIDLSASGDLDSLRVEGKLAAMLEGVAASLQVSSELAVDLEGGAATGRGTFALAPFSLQNSDIVTRWAPELTGVSVGATVGAEGTFASGPDGSWDGTAAVKLSGASVSMPERALKVEGASADLTLESLRELRVARGAKVGFSRVKYGDVELTDGSAHLHAMGPKILFIEDATVGVFGGTVTSGPFSLFFPDPDVAVVLKIEGLDVSQVVGKLDIFDGSMTGRLRGNLPVGLLAGQPVIGEGFLELDPQFPATLRYDARGKFTAGMPDKMAWEKINRLPYELLEEGLGGLRIAEMHVDLFDRKKPDTPIRIQFSGEAVTPRARVPLEIVANINGTVAQVLNLMLRLASL